MRILIAQTLRLALSQPLSDTHSKSGCAASGDVMERIWLKSYPPGIPADIDASHYASLVDLIEESMAAFAARTAFTCMGK